MIPDNEQYLEEILDQQRVDQLQEIPLADGEWLCTNLHQVSLALQAGGIIARRVHGHHVVSFDHPSKEQRYEAALMRASRRAGRVG